MAEDIEAFFTLKDELFLSVEYANSNASEADRLADKLLFLMQDIKPRINNINNKTLELSAQTNFPDLGRLLFLSL